MISENILKSLSSRSGDPAYTLVVTGYETGDDCNSEFIKIKMHQLNKGIDVIENGFSPISKELIIKGVLDFDEEEGTFIAKLAGTSNIKSNKEILPDIENINSHYIECVVTNIDKTLEIEFNRPYESIPSINITMDSSTNKNLFSNYECDFSKYRSNNQYHGVTITFNKLRKKSVYPEINILIIGDKIA